MREEFRKEFEVCLFRLRANDPTLTELDLGENKIRDGGAKDLAEALQGNTTLTKLELDDNYVSDEGCKALAETLASKENIAMSSFGVDYVDDEIGPSMESALESNHKLVREKQLQDGKVEMDKVIPKMLGVYVEKEELPRNIKDKPMGFPLALASSIIEMAITLEQCDKSIRRPGLERADFFTDLFAFDTKKVTAIIAQNISKIWDKNVQYGNSSLVTIDCLSA